MNNKLSAMATLGTGDQISLWLLPAALGLALALIGWALGRALISVPEEDRTYLDPPPLGFKLLWLTSASTGPVVVATSKAGPREPSPSKEIAMRSFSSSRATTGAASS